MHRSRNAAAHGIDFLLRVPLLQNVLVRVLGLVVHVHIGQQPVQFLAPRVSFQLLPQLAFLPGCGFDVLCALHCQLSRHRHRSCSRVHNAANGVCRAPPRPLRHRNGIIVHNIRPRLVDLLLAVPLFHQLRVGVLLSFRLLHRCRRAAHRTACALGLHGVAALGIGYAALSAADQRHQLPVLLVRVHPQVQLVKPVRLAVRRKAVLQPLRLFCVPAVSALRNGSFLGGVVPAHIVPVRFVVLLPVGLYRVAGRRAQYAVQHLVRQLLAVQRPQLPCAAAHPAGIRAALRQLHPGLQGAFRCHPHPAAAPALRHTVAYPICLVLLFLVVFLPPVHLFFGSRFCLRRVVSVLVLLILVLSLVIAAPLRHLCFCHCHSVLLYFSVPIAYAISSSEYPCNRRLL